MITVPTTPEDWRELEVQARAFAARAHRGQLYGNKPYTVHLAAVRRVLADFGIGDRYAVAAWLHDTIEDTGVTREEIAGRFTVAVGDLVWAVTGVGSTRRERNADAHAKIRAFPGAGAGLLKLCDRIANVEACRQNNPRLLDMYRKEHWHFEDLLDDVFAGAGGVPMHMINRLRTPLAFALRK